MKLRFILAFYILIYNFAITNAQDYRCIIPDQRQYFEIDPSYRYQIIVPFSFADPNHSPVKVMYFDSSAVILNGISHYSFSTWRYPDQIISSVTCAVQNGPSWTGLKVNELNDGTNLFFNIYSDTIRIKTLASVNNSWHFYNYNHGHYIKAKVDSIVWMQYGNIADSVKYISLNAFDSSGVLDSFNRVNGLSFLLSKSNGLLRTIDFYEFPDYPFFVNRIDSVSMPTVREIYDFNVNDEFEYAGFCANVEYRKVLSKTISSALDSVFYVYHNISNTINDTTTEAYPYYPTPLFNTLPEENNYNQPDSMYLNSYEISIDSNYNFIPVYAIINGYMFPKISGDTCYSLNTFEPPVSTIEFAKGLGAVESSLNNTAMMGYFCETKLIWYHKGNTYWGNATLATGISENSGTTICRIYPNPNHGNFIIDINNFKGASFCRMDIFNILGEIIYSQVLTDKVTSVQVSNLLSGIYTCKLYSDHYISQQRFIIN